MVLTITIIFCLIAYLCGSLSSAVIISKLMHLPDPRLNGSQNPGTTNVLRLGGKLPALLVLVLDILKGFLPVLLARLLHVEGFHLGLVAFAALIGHAYPIFLKFKGGKGVATFIGAITALSFPAGLAVAVTWIIVAIIFRYSSLAALSAISLSPIYIAIFTDIGYLLPIIAMVALIIFKHRSNIQRLRDGKESKIKLGSR